MKLEKLPIYILLMFTAVYMVADGSNSVIWNGLYFTSNYLILLLLFAQNRDSKIRLIGVSLSLAILIFIVLKFFISLEVEKLRYFNAFTFLLIFAGLYKLERK